MGTSLGMNIDAVLESTSDVSKAVANLVQELDAIKHVAEVRKKQANQHLQQHISNNGS